MVAEDSYAGGNEKGGGWGRDLVRTGPGETQGDHGCSPHIKYSACHIYAAEATAIPVPGTSNKDVLRL